MVSRLAKHYMLSGISLEDVAHREISGLRLTPPPHATDPLSKTLATSLQPYSDIYGAIFVSDTGGTYAGVAASLAAPWADLTLGERSARLFARLEATAGTPAAINFLAEAAMLTVPEAESRPGSNPVPGPGVILAPCQVPTETWCNVQYGRQTYA